MRFIVTLAACCLVAACGRDESAVVLWHTYTGEERAALEESARDLADSGLKVELVQVPFDTFADKITNAIPHGNGPDLFIFAHDRLGDWVATSLVEPIDYYVDETIADRFAYDAIAAMAYGDSVYGLPMAVKSVVLFYRTDMIATPPATTDELIARGDRLVYDNTDLYFHAPWLHGFGGDVFTPSGELAITTPASIAALTFARDLSRRGIVPSGATSTMVATLFNSGQAAMAISGPWFLGDIAEGVPWKIAPLPVVSATGKPAEPFLGAEGVLMSSRARDKDAAFAVMNALTSDAAALDRARSARQVIPNLGAYSDPSIAGDEVLGAFRTQLERSRPMPSTPEMRTVWTPYKTALQKAINAGDDPEQALRYAEREIRDYSGGEREPVNGGLKSYAIAASIAAAIAIAAFVSYRNRAYEQRELERAQMAARAVADGALLVRPVVVAAGVVQPATRSKKYPFLRRRQVIMAGATTPRPLGGAGAPASDKLLYDAAAAADAAGDFVRFTRDDTGRVIAAIKTARGVAIAVTQPPGGPEPFPWLVTIGLLVMGAMVTTAGAMVGGRSRWLGLGLGSCGLAVPTYLWAGLPPALAIAAVAAAVTVADRAGWFAAVGASIRRARVAYTFVAPTGLAMLVLVAAPFVFGLVLGFYDHHHGQWTFVGLDNFVDILSGGGRSLADPLNFWFTLGVTVVWTAINVAFHVTIGVALALWLRLSWLRGKSLFRVLLILPWAIPNYITALIWNGMFQSEYGAVNGLLEMVGIHKVAWFSDWATAFTANVCTNVWLGFPFMMVVALGALESIPRDMYEAAEVDGASAWQRFVHITLPHLRLAIAPAMVIGAIWTFNMVNVIYLVSEGQPGGGTDILVTQAYRWAFERGERYGLASAYGTVIFAILLLWTVFGTRTHRKDEP